jgi:hypothetical protein
LSTPTAEARARWYGENAASVIERTASRRREIRDMLRKRKDVPCTDCGQRYPHYVMDFDHVGEKTINPAQIASRGWGNERIEAELARCEVVCANCHRIRTHG